MKLTLKAPDDGRVITVGNRTHEEAMAQVLQEAFELRCRKHHDYGPGPIMEFGEYGILVRVGDKVGRLKNLLKPGFDGKVKDETIEDTWIDILNYALMAIMVRRGTFTLPVEEDVHCGAATRRSEPGWGLT